MSRNLSGRRGKRALLVEEEFYSRWFIRRLLEPYTRCDVVVRGEEAVDSFRISVDSGAPYEFVLLDMRLPEMSADAVLREIRAIEEMGAETGGARTKVILITTDGAVQEVPEQLREQCEGLIPKPIAEDDLLSQLQSLGLLSV